MLNERGEEGFSLLELMMVTAIFGVVAAAAMAFLISAQRTEKIVNDSTQQQANARVSLEQLSRTAREATYPQGYDYSNSTIMTSADKYEVTFFADVDGNGTVDKLRFRMDAGSTDLTRDVYVPDCTFSPCNYPDTPSQTRSIVRNVRNRDLSGCGKGVGSSSPLFRFYKADRGTGNLVEIATPTAVVNQLVDISYFEVNLVVDITPNRSPVCQDIKTSVNLRNWRGS